VSRPNILFILSDQQRHDTLGCYDANAAAMNLSPHLDALAARGARFETACTMQPVCGPARAAFQSGQYASRVGCHTNGRMLPTGIPTLAKRLNAAGYETAYVGKWHLATGDEDGGGAGRRFIREGVPQERRGGYRDYWMASDILEFTSSGYEGYYFDANNQRVDWEGYRVDKTTDFALDYLQQWRDRNPRPRPRNPNPSAEPASAGGSDSEAKPFFLFLSYIEPHHQNDLDRYIGPIGSKQRFAGYTTPGDLAAAGPDAGDWRKHYPDYLGCCWSLDQNVGRLLEALELHGIADETLIVYTSDHACHFRTRNSEYKRACHDNAVRVPLIVAGPDDTPFTGGKVIDDVVSLIALPPTLLEAAGADPLPDADGQPLQPLVAGEVSAGNGYPEEAYTEISETQTGRSIRTKRWTYSIQDAEDGDVGGWRDRGPTADRWREAFLYDNDADPHQQHNLVADPAFAGVRDTLRGRLAARMKAAGEDEPTIEPATEPMEAAR